MPHCRRRPTINPRWPIRVRRKWNGCVEAQSPHDQSKGPHSICQQTDRGIGPGRESRAAQSSIGIDFSASGRKSKQLLVAKDVTKRFNEKPVVTNLDLLLGPGQRAWASPWPERQR